MKTWNETKKRAIKSLRAAYLAEVTRFAESLRMRFKAGELRALVDEDLAQPGRYVPMHELERLVTAHFGLQIEEVEDCPKPGWMTLKGDEDSAHLVLAASMSSDAVEDGSDNIFLWATDAATWDVIRIARARGWYKPLPGECEDPLVERSVVAA
ncbi:MAG: hypothetical protein NDI82_02300 [Anaeromyxobacteraceae bacterium]|nr:hypothetical protein [Anaeromyxobacteraceae bacterium]